MKIWGQCVLWARLGIVLRHQEARRPLTQFNNSRLGIMIYLLHNRQVVIMIKINGRANQNHNHNQINCKAKG